MEVNSLSIEEKVGQMLMVGLNVLNPIKELKTLILKYKVGGVILYKKNYRNYDELVKLINEIKSMNSRNRIPIFIAIDQEGGRVNRMPKDFLNLPSSYRLAKNKGENLVKLSGEITARLLIKTGFNMNFAPVLDIKRFEDNHAIGDRAFGDNIEEIENYGIDYMKALQNNNIISVIKHFPGHGLTIKDSHFSIPKVKKDVKKIEEEDIYPFKKAIENGADSILVSHLIIKNMTQKIPASMSKKFITKYLRKKYRFRGLIITDDLKMKGVKFLLGKHRSIKKAFYAGNDMILFKYEKDEKLMNSIIEDVKSDSLKQARINRAVKRILNIKEKYNIKDDKIEIDKEFVKNINIEIQNIRDKV